MTEARKNVGQWTGMLLLLGLFLPAGLSGRFANWKYTLIAYLWEMKYREMHPSYLFLSPASYLSKFRPRKANSSTWSQWLLKMLDLKTQKWSSNQGLYQHQSLGSRVKVKERKNQCQRKYGYREESTVGRWF